MSNFLRKEVVEEWYKLNKEELLDDVQNTKEVGMYDALTEKRLYNQNKMYSTFYTIFNFFCDLLVSNLCFSYNYYVVNCELFLSPVSYTHLDVYKRQV